MERVQTRRQRRRQRELRFWLNNLIWLLAGILIGVLIARPHGESSQPAAASLQSEEIALEPTSTEEAEAEAEVETYNDPDIPDEIEAAAQAVGERYSIVPELLEAIAWYGSRYDTDALNGSHVGLMQVSVYWHSSRMEELGISNAQLWQPDKNMTVAADYLVELMEQNDDLTWALMKYNGSRNADAYLNGEAEASEYAIQVQELMVSLLNKHDQTAEEVTSMLAEK